MQISLQLVLSIMRASQAQKQSDEGSPPCGCFLGNAPASDYRNKKTEFFIQKLLQDVFNGGAKIKLGGQVLNTKPVRQKLNMINCFLNTFFQTPPDLLLRRASKNQVMKHRVEILWCHFLKSPWNEKFFTRRCQGIKEVCKFHD